MSKSTWPKWLRDDDSIVACTEIGLSEDAFRHLGVPDGDLRSSWANTSRIVTRAEELGFRNILCPSSYQVGQDTLTFAAAVAPKTSRMNLLAAIRCGEMHPRHAGPYRGHAGPHSGRPPHAQRDFV